MLKDVFLLFSGAKQHFEKYLYLSGITWPEFHEADQVKQCNIMSGYVKCLRKQGSYKNDMDRVCVFCGKRVFLGCFDGDDDWWFEKGEFFFGEI